MQIRWDIKTGYIRVPYIAFGNCAFQLLNCAAALRFLGNTFSTRGATHWLFLLICGEVGYCLLKAILAIRALLFLNIILIKCFESQLNRVLDLLLVIVSARGLSARHIGDWQRSAPIVLIRLCPLIISSRLVKILVSFLKCNFFFVALRFETHILLTFSRLEYLTLKLSRCVMIYRKLSQLPFNFDGVMGMRLITFE